MVSSNRSSPSSSSASSTSLTESYTIPSSASSVRSDKAPGGDDVGRDDGGTDDARSSPPSLPPDSPHGDDGSLLALNVERRRLRCVGSGSEDYVSVRTRTMLVRVGLARRDATGRSPCLGKQDAWGRRRPLTTLAMAASCVAAALLSHGPLAPVSSASANHARMPPSMQLIILEESVAQSRASVLREMLLRAEERYACMTDAAP